MKHVLSKYKKFILKCKVIDKGRYTCLLLPPFWSKIDPVTYGYNLSKKLTQIQNSFVSMIPSNYYHGTLQIQDKLYLRYSSQPYTTKENQYDYVIFAPN